MPAAASSASGGALPPNMQTLPFLQKDVVNLMERKAVLRPHAPLSARANRPRSAEHSAQEVASARPKTSDDNRRRVGGYAFPAGSSPRPEVLAAASIKQPISALEAARRHRLKTAAPDDPQVDEILPPITAFPFQPNAADFFMDGAAANAPGMLPPQSSAMLYDGGRSDPSQVAAVAPPPTTRRPSSATSAKMPQPLTTAITEGGGGGGGGVDGGAEAPGPSAAAAGGGRTTSPEREKARDTLRRQGAPEFASVEAITEAVDERTNLLTRIFQEKLSQQAAVLVGMREAEARAHEKEVRELKDQFKDRLSEAVDKVRAVHATNRDAVEILAKNKRLRAEVSRLKNDTEKAYAAQKDAEERERLKGEEGAAVVQQLMTQLQEKESLLAAGAGAMSPEEREAMLEKERARAQQAAEKEKARIEAAMAEERAKSAEKLATLEEKLAEANDLVSAARKEHADASKELDKERKSHTKAKEKLDTLEKKWAAMADQRERLAALEKATSEATKMIVSSLGYMKEFIDKTNEHLNVDLSCLSCLQPLHEAHVLVPCGHSVCLQCARKLESNARMTEMGPIKECPICAEKNPLLSLDAEEMPNVEAFPNTMLDALVTRLSQKTMDAQGLNNMVLGIFDQGGTKLPKGADALRPPPSPSSPQSKPSTPIGSPAKKKL